MPTTWFVWKIYFNPRSREGSDSSDLSLWKFFWTFQSTLPRRERLILLSIFPSSSRFQSTLPRRERQLFHADPGWNRRNFNPRSREGSDMRPHVFADIPDISIHAPAKGATSLLGQKIDRDEISIHAPAKGATMLKK